MSSELNPMAAAGQSLTNTHLQWPRKIQSSRIRTDLELLWNRFGQARYCGRRSPTAKIVKADTLKGLATAITIAPDGLVATFESWNEDVKKGYDSTFEKPPTMLLPVSKTPFYAVELGPAIIGMTFAGLRIDDKARVLNSAGRPIAGLYAAGELAGGLIGWIYSGGGVSIGMQLHSVVSRAMVLPV